MHQGGPKGSAPLGGPDLSRADTRHESRLTMRRILAKHDKGPDVALIQELLNRIMPFEGSFRAPRDVPSLWAQAAPRRRGPAAAANPLRAPITLFSWGYVRTWDDLRYFWAPGAPAAARHLGHRSKPSHAETGCAPSPQVGHGPAQDRRPLRRPYGRRRARIPAPRGPPGSTGSSARRSGRASAPRPCSPSALYVAC